MTTFATGVAFWMMRPVTLISPAARVAVTVGVLAVVAVGVGGVPVTVAPLVELGLGLGSVAVAEGEGVRGVVPPGEGVDNAGGVVTVWTGGWLGVPYWGVSVDANGV
jgi:hypothetical protein